MLAPPARSKGESGARGPVAQPRPPAAPRPGRDKLRAVPRRPLLRRAPRALALILALAAAAAALSLLATPSAEPLVRANPGTTALLEQRRAEASAQGRPF